MSLYLDKYYFIIILYLCIYTLSSSIKKSNMLIKFILLTNIIFMVNAMNINILNRCPYKIDIYSHEKSQFINKCSIWPNKNCNISITQPVFESGLIKTLNNDEVTLFEFTKNKYGIWYDISVIPPYSFNRIPKKGFNIPLTVDVKQSILNSRCNKLICLHSKCPDAYLYPYDNTKTHYCNLNTNFTLTYCI